MTSKLLIFDFDGVLVDSEVLWSEAMATVLTRLGYPISVEDCQRRFTGATGTAVRTLVEAETEQPLDPAFVTMVRDAAYELLAVDLKVIDGAESLLRSLNGPRCIASNSSLAWIDRGLRGAKLDGYFLPSHRFSSEQVAEGKPAPHVFLHAASMMGAEPVDCLVIEDSIHGVTGARAAGMRVIGFTGASHTFDDHADVLRQAGVDAVFDDLTQLPDVLQAL